MQFTDLNIDAIEELKRTDGRKKVWVWNDSWIRTDALEFNLITGKSDTPIYAFRWKQLKDTTMLYAVPTFDTEKFLYVVSDTQPNWYPDLLTLSEAKLLVTTLDLSINTWCLDKHGWYLVGHPLSTDLSDKYVYLIQTNEPTYHPLQQEIAKLILEGEKMLNLYPLIATNTATSEPKQTEIIDVKPVHKRIKVGEGLLHFSSDQNHLVINNGELKGEYKAKNEASCTGCSFYVPTNKGEDCKLINPHIAKCDKVGRDKSELIIWVKDDKTMPEEIKSEPRKHADLIKKWLGDSSLKVYFWNEDCWREAIDPTWAENLFYAVGEMPTEPPISLRKRLNVNVDAYGSSYTFDLEVPINATDQQIKEQINQAIFEKTVCTYKVI